MYMIDLGEFSGSIMILQGEPIEIKVARLRWDGPHRLSGDQVQDKGPPELCSSTGIQSLSSQILFQLGLLSSQAHLYFVVFVK